MIGSADESLHLAVRAHRAGRLAQAEQLFRQVLLTRPDQPDALFGCAMIQLGQNRPADAAQMLDRLVRVRADLPAAHFHFGRALAASGRFGEAAQAFGRAVRLHPSAEGYINLGNAQLYGGDRDGAVAAYRRAIDLDPANPEAHNNLGWALIDAGDACAAEASLREALRLAPAYAEAHNNLGRSLHAQARHAEACTAFEAAARAAPTLADAHANLAASRLKLGEAAAGEAAAQAALRIDPDHVDASLALANAVREQRRLDEAVAICRRVIDADPGDLKAHEILANCLLELGDLDQAFVMFDRAALLAAQRPGADVMGPAHKGRHDQEQRAWRETAPATARPPGERVAGAAVQNGPKVEAVQAAWRNRRPQIVTIDDLLTPQALESLRQYCLRAPAWRSAYARGYLGATPEQGFTPPILAQIAQELRSVYPEIIGDHPLMYFWAFKYDSRLDGIRIHADFAAVNVNFWITPDEANLDPARGGLIVHDVAAPLDWTFERYNAAEDEIRALVAQSAAPPAVIPYRSNRAVIFDSDLFHETDAIAFADGYENRRLNVTLLFGRREAAGGA